MVNKDFHKSSTTEQTFDISRENDIHVTLWPTVLVVVQNIEIRFQFHFWSNWSCLFFLIQW